MRFLGLILVNLRRHRVRALIGISGIGFGVTAMLTILAIVNGAIGMFENILSTDSEYLVLEKNVSDLFFSAVSDQQTAAIRSLPEVAAVYPLLFGIVSSPGFPVITCFGLQPDDPRLTKARWLAGRAADFGRRPGEVFLGSRAANFLHAQLGETVTIGAATRRVAGIIKTENGFEDGGIFLPLADAQLFFHRPAVCSVLAIKLTDSAAGEKFKHRVEDSFPGLIALENREFSQGYHSFRILKTMAWAVGVCAFLLGGLGVANTMLLSVFGRIREIAILRVCGFSESQVAALIIGEAAVLAAAGLVAGFALGAAVLAALPHVPQFQGYVNADVRPAVVAAIIATALLTAVAGSIYPARFASRVQPAEALRYE